MAGCFSFAMCDLLFSQHSVQMRVFWHQLNGLSFKVKAAGRVEPPHLQSTVGHSTTSPQIQLDSTEEKKLLPRNVAAIEHIHNQGAISPKYTYELISLGSFFKNYFTL